MTVDQKRIRANQLLKDMGFPITADTWTEDVINAFLHFND